MKLLHRFTKNRFSIRIKLFFAYFLVALLPVLLLGFSAYGIARDSARQEAMAAILQSQQQLSNVIDTTTLRLENASRFLSSNSDLIRFLKGNFSSAYEEYQVAGRMSKTLESTMWGLGGSVAITAISYSEQANEIVAQDFDDRYKINSMAFGSLNPSGTNRMAIYRASRYRNEAWFQRYRGVDRGFSWMITDQDAQFGNVSLLMQIFEMDLGDNAVGMLKLTVRQQDIHSSSPGTVDEYMSFLLDEHHKPLPGPVPSGEAWISINEGYGQYIDSLQDNSPLVVDDTVLVLSPLSHGWKLLGVYTMQSFRVRLARLTGQVMLYGGIAIVTVAIVSLLMARSFSVRISRVTNGLRRFRQGDHAARADVDGTDEVGQLASGFNEMAEKIDSLINDVYKAELKVHQEHLVMLQSQINPHFLYNSLSAIIRLAEREEPAMVKDMTMALVRFYRLSLSKGNALIPFANEIEHVKAYIEVFLIRRRNDFHAEFVIKPETQDIMVPKVILQPFVENAIEHGMNPNGSMMHILVSAYTQGNELICLIQDNGIGMSQQAIDGALGNDGPFSNGYGVKNVDERIKAYFGNKWGVTIQSGIGVGTSVTLRMPVSNLHT